MSEGSHALGVFLCVFEFMVFAAMEQLLSKVFSLLDCHFLGPLAKESRLLGLIFLCSLAFLGFWLLQLQVWDLRLKKENQGTHHFVVSQILGLLTFLPSFLPSTFHCLLVLFSL